MLVPDFSQKCEFPQNLQSVLFYLWGIGSTNLRLETSTGKMCIYSLQIATILLIRVPASSRQVKDTPQVVGVFCLGGGGDRVKVFGTSLQRMDHKATQGGGV